MVAASLNHPEWRNRSGAEGGIGLGGIGVGLGGPRQTGPFPGSPPQNRLPQPPRAPGSDNPGGLDPAERESPEQLLAATALPEGAHSAPFAGFLYFPYKGKISGIKSLELLYGGAALKLR